MKTNIGKPLAFTAWLAMALPFAVAAQSGSWTDDFGNASDINTYVDDVQATSHAPGALEVAQAKAVDECGFILLNPNYTALAVAGVDHDGLKYALFRRQALETTQKRCHDFALHTSLHFGDAFTLFTKAEAEGNLDAIAFTLSYELLIAKKDSQTIAHNALKVASSGSPYALFVMADLLDDHGPFASTSNGEVGTKDSTWAWQLVACDRGLNCSATSPVVQNACMMRGICGPGDYRTNLQYSALSPKQYQTVAKAEASINAMLAIRSISALFHQR